VVFDKLKALPFAVELLGRSRQECEEGCKGDIHKQAQECSVTEMDEVTGVEEKKRILVGFTFQPIFRVEDTESEPLSVYEPMQLPPLVEVAKPFGVSVN